MKIFCKFPTVNISKLNCWLVICIAKDFILSASKAIFSVFRFFWAPSVPDFQIVVSQTNIVYPNKTHQWKAYLFFHTSQCWPLWLVLFSRVTFGTSSIYWLVKRSTLLQFSKWPPYGTLGASNSHAAITWTCRAAVSCLHQPWSLQKQQVCF